MSADSKRPDDDMGNRFPNIHRRLRNLFPSLRVPVALEEGVKRFAIHLCLARGGADVAVATSQDGLGVRELEACQVLFPSLFPRQAGKMAVGRGRSEERRVGKECRS